MLKTTVEPRMGTAPVQLAVTHGTLRVSLVLDGTLCRTPLTRGAQAALPLPPYRHRGAWTTRQLTTVVEPPSSGSWCRLRLGSRVQTVEIDPQRTARVNVVMDAPRTQLLTDAIDLTENLWFPNSVEIPASRYPSSKSSRP